MNLKTLTADFADERRYKKSDSHLRPSAKSAVKTFVASEIRLSERLSGAIKWALRSPLPTLYRLTLSLTLSIPFCLSSPAATNSLITGNLLLISGSPSRTNILFTPLSTPLQNNTTNLVISTPTNVVCDSNGAFTVALHPGDYHVSIGSSQRDKLFIAVPTNSGTYQFTSLITNALTYTDHANPSYASASSLNGKIDVDAGSGTSNQFTGPTITNAAAISGNLYHGHLSYANNLSTDHSNGLYFANYAGLPVGRIISDTNGIPSLVGAGTVTPLRFLDTVFPYFDSGGWLLNTRSARDLFPLLAPYAGNEFGDFAVPQNNFSIPTTFSIGSRSWNFDSNTNSSSVARLADIPRAAIATNGLINSNDFSIFAIRNYNHALYRVPPMGWSSWPGNGSAVTEAIVSNAVRQIVVNHYDQLGYTLIHIDDGWMSATRDAGGNLVADPVKFPSGSSGLLNLIHTNGLKAEMYFALGAHTASGFLGSAGHIYQDATNYAALGLDAFRLVVDDVGYDLDDNSHVSPNLLLCRNFLAPLTELSRPYHVTANSYQLAGWMKGSINSIIYGTAAPTYGGLAQFFDPSGTQTNLINFLDFYAAKRFWLEPGSYFDTGWIPTGNQGTYGNFGLGAARRTQGIFSMMCLAQFQANFDTTSDFQQVKTNRLLCKISQDPLVIPARVVATNSVMECLYRPLANSKGALAFYNRSFNPSTNNLTIGWTNIGIDEGNYLLTDVWTGDTTICSSNAFGISITNDTFALYYIEPLGLSAAIQPGTYLYSDTTIVNGIVFTSPTTYGLPIGTNIWLSRFWIPMAAGGGDKLIFNLQFASTNSTPYKFDLTTELFQPDNTIFSQISRPAGTNIGAGIFDTISAQTIGTANYRAGWFGLQANIPANGGNTNTLFFVGGSVYRTKQ